MLPFSFPNDASNKIWSDIFKFKSVDDGRRATDGRRASGIL